MDEPLARRQHGADWTGLGRVENRLGSARSGEAVGASGLGLVGQLGPEIEIHTGAEHAETAAIVEVFPVEAIGHVLHTRRG